MDESPVTGPGDSQVLHDVRQQWQKDHDKEISLRNIFIHERDVMAADRVRFEVLLVFDVMKEGMIIERLPFHEKRSIIYRLFGDKWQEHRY